MIEIYIGSERLDTFKDEDVNIKLNLQNVKDISKLFTDYTQNFQVPASKTNNSVFKHYYNADISGGFQASLRQDATMFVNKENNSSQHDLQVVAQLDTLHVLSW